MALTEGCRIFPFCLEDQKGESLCTDDLSGKWAVLFIYVRDLTPG